MGCGTEGAGVCVCVMRAGTSLTQVHQAPQAAQMLKVAFSDLCEQESRGRH